MTARPFDMRRLAEEVYRPQRPVKQYRQVVVNKPYDILSADLIDLSRWDAKPGTDEDPALTRENEGHKYIFAIMDCFSRYLWTVPLKSKDAKTLLAAYKSVVDTLPRPPLKLWTDQEGGIISKSFQAFLKSQGTVLYHTFSNEGAVQIERLIRTYGNWLQRELFARGSTKWLDAYADITEKWNAHRVRTTGFTPVDALKPNNTRAIFEKLYGAVYPHAEPEFEPGAYVRLAMTFDPLEKKSRRRMWTTEVFVVKSVKKGQVPMYQVEDLAGEPVEGSFYAQELQRTEKPDFEAAYPIEAVLKQRKRAGQQEALVKFLSLPDAYNKWVPLSSLEKL